MTAIRTGPFTRAGETLEPGKNVDRIDYERGVAQAKAFGYCDELALIVVTYVLQRWARGEEAGALQTWRAEFPRDITSFYAIIAAAAAPQSEGSCQ